MGGAGLRRMGFGLIMLLAVFLPGAACGISNFTVNESGAAEITAIAGLHYYLELMADAATGDCCSAVRWGVGALASLTCVDKSDVCPPYGSTWSAWKDVPDTPGTYTINVALYGENDCGGDPLDTRTRTLIVEEGDVDVTLTVDAPSTPVRVTDEVTLTATVQSLVTDPYFHGIDADPYVASGYASASQVVGDVTFYADSSELGSVRIYGTGGSGSVSLDTTLPLGTPVITAEYVCDYAYHADTTSSGETVTVLEATPPTVESIVRADSNPTNAASVDFTVTFSESVTGVGTSNFSIDATGGQTGASISGVSGSGDTWTVSVTTVDDEEGTLSIDLDSPSGIEDTAGNELETGYTSGQAYDVDRVDPELISVTKLDDSPTNAASWRYLITFSEAVVGLTTDHLLAFAQWGGATVTIDSLTGTGATRTVTVSTSDDDFDDYIQLDVRSDAIGVVEDSVGNTLQSLGSDPSESYAVDRKDPLITYISNSRSGLVVNDDAAGFELSITVTLDDEIDQTTTPAITFTADVSGTLTFDRYEWPSSSSYRAVYTIGDGDEEIDPVQVSSVTGILDDVGNPLAGLDPGASYDDTEFGIDNENPSVTYVSFSPDLIVDHDGGYWFDVYLTFDEEMDEAYGPDIEFSPDVASTLSEDYYTWSYESVTVTYDVTDADVDEDSVVIDVSGCYDVNGNAMQTYVTPDPANDWFGIDTENPQATVTTSHTTIAGGDPIYEGSLVLTVTVSYDEPMDTADAPTISMVGGGSHWGSQSGLGWSGDTIYRATFAHDGTEEEISGALARVEDASGAHDEPAGNDDLGDDSPTFDIDTKKPSATIGLSHTLIADANVGETFTVTLEYDEAMDTGIDPTVDFFPLLDTTLSLSDSSWTDDDTYVLTCTILDGGVTVDDDNVQVCCGRDEAGNLQNTANRDDLDVDTENPVISGEVVTGGEVDSSCLRVVTFSATVTDPNGTMNSSDIEIVSAQVTTGNASYGSVYDVVRTDPTQATATISGKIDVYDLTGCPATVEVVFDAVDAVGNEAVSQETAEDDVSDPSIYPEIHDLTFSQSTYYVEDCCEVLVSFSGYVTDNCCIRPANVSAAWTNPTDNIHIVESSIVWTATQDAVEGQKRVNFEGSAVVRCLDSCPAEIRVDIEAYDCCGPVALEETDYATCEIRDETPPTPRDDPYGYETGRVDDLEVRIDGAGTYRLMARQDTPVYIDVVHNDSDNCSCLNHDPCGACVQCGEGYECDNPLQIFDIVDEPEYGALQIVDDYRASRNDRTSIRYAPDLGYAGPDEFTYRIVDGCGNVSGIATVYVQVIRELDADDVYVTTCAGETVGFEVTASDLYIDHGDPTRVEFTFTLVDGPENGVLTGDLADIVVSAPSEVEDPATGETVPSIDFTESAAVWLEYTPAAGFVGRDEIVLAFADPYGNATRIYVDIVVSDCGAAVLPVIRVEAGEVVALIVPATFAEVVATAAWETVELSHGGVSYAAAMSAAWSEALGRYVLAIDTTELPPGRYELMVPLGNGETVELIVEVGEGR